MLAKKVKEGIEKQLQEGKNVYLTTGWKHFKVTPKAFHAWDGDLFRIDNEGNLRYNKNIICTPTMLLVKVTVENEH